MVGRLRTWSYYVAFVAFVTIALWVAPPKPDPFPFDYTAMSAGYGSLLAGLGGFAITVLAVMLGLEALDAQRSTRVHVAAHGVVLRHVSLSLAIASVTCFVGALMLAEVNAQAASVVRAKEDASAEIGQHLEAMGLGQADIADRMLQLKGSGVAPFGPTSQVAALAN